MDAPDYLDLLAGEAVVSEHFRIRKRDMMRCIRATKRFCGLTDPLPKTVTDPAYRAECGMSDEDRDADERSADRDDPRYREVAAIGRADLYEALMKLARFDAKFPRRVRGTLGPKCGKISAANQEGRKVASTLRTSRRRRTGAEFQQARHGGCRPRRSNDDRRYSG